MTSLQAAQSSGLRGTLENMREISGDCEDSTYRHPLKGASRAVPKGSIGLCRSLGLASLQCSRTSPGLYELLAGASMGGRALSYCMHIYQDRPVRIITPITRRHAVARTEAMTACLGGLPNMYRYIHTYTCIYIYIHISICIYIYIYVCVCVYV